MNALAPVTGIFDHVIRVELDRREGWVAIAPRGHAWAFADRADAVREARWLSRNFGLPIREVRQ